MAPRRPRQPFALLKPRLKIVVISLTLAVGAGFVIWSPLLMYQLLGESMPWPRLADVGEAYGGASALLSAAALSGIGASLFLQSRQMRQELMSLDKQRHFELVKLALDNPEFFEILDGGPLDAQDGKRRVYANLALTYWLAMWELGEIGDAELRSLTSTMFNSRVSRDWWQQVNGYWITVHSRRRRQFIRIVQEQWTSATARVDPGSDASTTSPVLDRETPERTMQIPATLWFLAGSAVAAVLMATHLRGRWTRRNSGFPEGQGRRS
jgi:hypothetical protein